MVKKTYVCASLDRYCLTPKGRYAKFVSKFRNFAKSVAFKYSFEKEGVMHFDEITLPTHGRPFKGFTGFLA
jgi:hypothetical protein